MRAADALFTRPSSQPMQRPVAISGTSAERSDTGSPPTSAERGGRILRALDEPPPPQLVALEAAHAPKRRGRKPGSKNKPKIKPVEPATEVASATMPGAARKVQNPGVSEDHAPLVAQTAHAGMTSAMRKLEVIPSSTPPNGSPSNGSKRFSWVRDRLKPGEGWKRRRLPRICW